MLSFDVLYKFLMGKKGEYNNKFNNRLIGNENKFFKTCKYEEHQ